jgi:hypothetical protein
MSTQAVLMSSDAAFAPNTNTAANVDSPWLFPGYRPGQPSHRSYLMKLVRDSGVHLLGGRNSALRQLVLDMPPAIAAQALGYSPKIAEAHARNAGTKRGHLRLLPQRVDAKVNGHTHSARCGGPSDPFAPTDTQRC